MASQWEAEQTRRQSSPGGARLGLCTHGLHCPSFNNEVENMERWEQDYASPESALISKADLPLQPSRVDSALHFSNKGPYEDSTSIVKIS